MLIPGETLEAMAIQRRVFALSHRRQAVGATSGRLIVVQRGLFGGFNPVDFRWQDLRESDVRVGVFGASLSLSSYRSNDLATNEGPPSRMVIEGLRKSEAQEVYRVCQARAQAWREKRRIRELEELRAKAGGIQVGALAAPSAARRPAVAIIRRRRGSHAQRKCWRADCSTTPNSNRSRRRFSPSSEAVRPYLRTVLPSIPSSMSRVSS